MQTRHNRSLPSCPNQPHRAAPDAFHWTFVWVAAVALSTPLFVWGGYGLATGQFWIPPISRIGAFYQNFATGTEATVYSAAAIIAGIGTFLHAGVRDIDGWRGRVDWLNQGIAAVLLCLVIAGIAMHVLR